MTIAVLTWGVLGILFGIIFVADYWVGREGNKSLKYFGLLNILTGIIPAVGQALGLELPVSATYSFFIMMVGTAIVTLALLLLYSHFVIVKRAQQYGVFITWWDVLIQGYVTTKGRVDLAINAYDERISKLRSIPIETSLDRLAMFLTMLAKDALLQVQDVIKETTVPEKSKNPHADKFLGIISYFLLSIKQFIPATSCRVSMRVWNQQTDEMVCIFSEQMGGNHRPGPIPMTEDNMILRALAIEKTAIYSENPEHHFRTTHDTICKTDSPLKDYATQYVMRVNGPEDKPRTIFSIMIDVTEDQVPNLKLLAKAGVFNLIGLAIASVFRSEYSTSESELIAQLLSKSKDTDAKYAKA